jgi:dTDP-4-dehydrorhamnose reductase
MQAIKEIIPVAKLVQTEDVGKWHGTPKLQDQWEMENERRWASLDILTRKSERKQIH